MAKDITRLNSSISNFNMKFRLLRFRILLFIVFFGGVLFWLSGVLIPKQEALPWNTASKVKGFYQIPPNSLDVLFVGSSHAFCSFNPYIFYKEANIKSYIFAANEQPLWTTYYYIKEALKYQKPKVIVLECLYISQEGHYQREAVNRLNLDYIPFSINKLGMVIASEGGNYVNALPFYRYHDRWKNMTYRDFALYSDGFLMGYTPLYIATDKEYMPSWKDAVKSVPLPDKNQKYLFKMIEICKRNDIELVLTYTPYQADKKRLSHILTLDSLASANSVKFMNYLDDSIIDDIGFNFRRDMEGGHTNMRGAEKVSHHLAKYLKSKYTFEGKRDFSIYEAIGERLETLDTLPKIKRLNDYVDYLKDKDVNIYIAVKDDASRKLTDQLKPLGSKLYWGDKSTYSYIGIFNPKQEIAEETSGPLLLSKNINPTKEHPFPLKIESGGTTTGNLANIFINSTNYAKGKRGLCIAVYDEKMNKVLDFASFDTHGSVNPERNVIYNADTNK